MKTEIERVVATQLGHRKVTARDRLKEDLGAESADLMNLIATIEDKYGLTVSEEDGANLTTVADLIELAERLLGRTP